MTRHGLFLCVRQSGCQGEFSRPQRTVSPGCMCRYVHPPTCAASIVGCAVANVLLDACLGGVLCAWHDDGDAADRIAGGNVLIGATLAVCKALPFSRWSCLRQVKAVDMPRVKPQVLTHCTWNTSDNERCQTQDPSRLQMMSDRTELQAVGMAS